MFPDSLQHLIRNDEPLASYTWLKIGGPARFFAEPTSKDELVAIVKAASESEVPLRVLGGGSNLLVREAGFAGLVVSLSTASFAEIRTDGTKLIAGGGSQLSHVVTTAVGKGLEGLGHLIGIPGTLGGALQGNASAGGSDVARAIESIEILTPEGDVVTKARDQLEFSYRQSDLGENIVLSATFALEEADPAVLTKRLQKLWIVRRGERPRDQIRVATPFVDPDGASAADLIDQVGMKGAREGAASLDPSKPNYLVVDEGATSEEVLALVENVREHVSLKTGVDLQLNLKIW